MYHIRTAACAQVCTFCFAHIFFSILASGDLSRLRRFVLPRVFSVGTCLLPLTVWDCACSGVNIVPESAMIGRDLSDV